MILRRSWLAAAMNLRISPGEPAQRRTAPPLAPYQAAARHIQCLSARAFVRPPVSEVWAARRVVMQPAAPGSNLAPDQGVIRAAPSRLWIAVEKSEPDKPAPARSPPGLGERNELRISSTCKHFHWPWLPTPEPRPFVWRSMSLGIYWRSPGYMHCRSPLLFSGRSQ